MIKYLSEVYRDEYEVCDAEPMLPISRLPMLLL